MFVYVGVMEDADCAVLKIICFLGSGGDGVWGSGFMHMALSGKAVDNNFTSRRERTLHVIIYYVYVVCLNMQCSCLFCQTELYAIVSKQT